MGYRAMPWAKLRSFLFNNNTIRQTVLKNTFWLTVSNFGSRAIKAILIIYVARHLGSGGYGVFSYTVSIAALFAIVSDVGIKAILVREASKNPASTESYFSTGLSIKLVLSVVSGLLIILIAPLITKIPEAVPLFPLAALLILFDGVRDFTYAITRAKEKMQIEAGIHSATNIAITVFGLIAISINATPYMLLVGYIAGSGTGMLIALWYFRDYFISFWRRVKASIIVRIFKEAWPFALVSALGVIMGHTDSIMLGWFSGAEQVGLYNAAFRPIQLLYFMPVVIGSSVFPVLARMANKDDEKFRTIFETVLSATFLFSIPLSVGGLLLGSQIVEFIFGPTYLLATLAFTILIFTTITNFPSPILINGIFSYGKQKLFALALSIGAIGNILLNIILIPRYGIMGSAIATLAAQFLAYSTMWHFMYRISRFHVFNKLGRIIVGTIVMGVAILLVRPFSPHVVVTIFIGVGIYAGMLYVLKEPILRNLKPENLIS